MRLVAIAAVLAASVLGCAAAPAIRRPHAVAPLPATFPQPAPILAGADRLPPTTTVPGMCALSTPLVLEGTALLRLTDDRTTVIEGGGIVPVGDDATLVLESQGTSTIWLFLDMRHASSIVIRGDIGARALRIRATGPRGAYHIHLRDLRTGGIGQHTEPDGTVHLEEGLVFLQGASSCGICGLEDRPPECAP